MLCVPTSLWFNFIHQSLHRHWPQCLVQLCMMGVIWTSIFNLRTVCLIGLSSTSIHSAAFCNWNTFTPRAFITHSYLHWVMLTQLLGDIPDTPRLPNPLVWSSSWYSLSDEACIWDLYRFFTQLSMGSIESELGIVPMFIGICCPVGPVLHLNPYPLSRVLCSHHLGD